MDQLDSAALCGLLSAAQVDDWAETLRFVPLPEDGGEL